MATTPLATLPAGQIIGMAAVTDDDGNDLVLLPSAKNGTGTVDGKVIVRQPGGTPGTDEGYIYREDLRFIIRDVEAAPINMVFGTGGKFVWAAQDATGTRVVFNAAGVETNLGYFAVGNGDPLTTSPDIVLWRDAANVFKVTTTNSGTGSGWLQNTAGSLSMAAAVDSTDTSLATLTGLSATLIAGRTYKFRAVLFVTTNGAAAGYKLGFGGTATATSFIANAQEGNEAGTVGQFPRVTALSGTFTSGAAAVITATIYIDGTVTVNAGGTFTITGAQQTDTGTTTWARGGSLIIEDMVAS